MLGGLFLLLVPATSIGSLTRSISQHELSEDPHDFFAVHLLKATNGLTRGATAYAGAYLLSHGVAKVVVVVALLRDRLWAYPAMIALLSAFILYQLYRLSHHVTIGLSLLTVFDAFVVWLTAREWRARR